MLVDALLAHETPSDLGHVRIEQVYGLWLTQQQDSGAGRGLFFCLKASLAVEMASSERSESSASATTCAVQSSSES